MAAIERGHILVHQPPPDSHHHHMARSRTMTFGFYDGRTAFDHPGPDADALLVILIRKHLGVEVDRAKLRAFLQDHFHKVSPLAHAIHRHPMPDPLQASITMEEKR
jgi:hypothetical protein